MKVFTSIIGVLALLAACNNGAPAGTNDTEPAEETMAEAKTEKTMQAQNEEIYVVMETSMGNITIALDKASAPVTVDNFLSYVDKGHYNGTIFHRVISNFMIQGGGFTPDGAQKPTADPIVLESDNGLSNDVGTIAMARTNAPNSATSQFFINVVHNKFLDFAPGNPGYAVFGRVTSGMEVVNSIRQVPTGRFQQMGDWPVDAVIINKVYRM